MLIDLSRDQVLDLLFAVEEFKENFDADMPSGLQEAYDILHRAAYQKLYDLANRPSPWAEDSHLDDLGD